jgi:hypothetical protein
LRSWWRGMVGNKWCSICEEAHNGAAVRLHPHLAD